MSIPNVALRLVLVLFGLAAHAGKAAEEPVLNVYSARHYQTDQELYAGFTRATGIRVDRIEAAEEALIQRILAEGERSPADVLVTVDAGRLWRAQQLGVFQSVRSAMLESRIPAAYRDLAGHWFAFSLRARLVFFRKAAVGRAEAPATYEALADPRWKGRLCVRSAMHPYNLSLVGAMIAHLGPEKAEGWARGVVANLARPPRGGDTDQLRAAAHGECDIALGNHYYYVRLALERNPRERAIAERLGVVFPNQDGRGTHFNVSGAGVARHAPHREAAVRFLEYLAGDQAQRHFADGNNEWPVVASVVADNPVLASFGEVKHDALNVADYARRQVDAQRLLDRVGWR